MKEAWPKTSMLSWNKRDLKKPVAMKKALVLKACATSSETFVENACVKEKLMLQVFCGIPPELLPPKGSQKGAKGNQKEPKGTKREPKEAKREPKWAKMYMKFFSLKL